MASKIKPVVSKLKPIVQAVRGGCRPDNPRLACQAAEAARTAGRKLKEQWPGAKIRAEASYEVWKSSVKSGGEFVSLVYDTAKLGLIGGCTFALVHVAHNEYTRPETPDADSNYEKTRAMALKMLHCADPALAKLYELVTGVKVPEPDAHQTEQASLKRMEELVKNILEETRTAFMTDEEFERAVFCYIKLLTTTGVFARFKNELLQDFMWHVKGGLYQDFKVDSPTGGDVAGEPSREHYKSSAGNDEGDDTGGQVKPPLGV